MPVVERLEVLVLLDQVFAFIHEQDKALLRCHREFAAKYQGDLSDRKRLWHEELWIRQVVYLLRFMMLFDDQRYLLGISVEGLLGPLTPLLERVLVLEEKDLIHDFD